MHLYLSFCCRFFALEEFTHINCCLEAVDRSGNWRLKIWKGIKWEGVQNDISGVSGYYIPEF
uniref:Uncharacterized protein n=1 Tax=Anguilla anguilla TaxID=7936 RepID=A0A0E9XTQ6_ANGAN